LKTVIVLPSDFSAKEDSPVHRRWGCGKGRRSTFSSMTPGARRKMKTEIIFLLTLSGALHILTTDFKFIPAFSMQPAGWPILSHQFPMTYWDN
jgi:hypothetical protein